MKRIIAVLMVLVLLCLGTAYAEKNSDEAFKTLQMINSMYKISPSIFVGDKVVVTYLTYQMFATNQNYDIYSSYQTLASNSLGAEFSSQILEIDKPLYKGTYKMMQEMDLPWVKWLDGEISDEECMSEMMIIVDRVVTAYEKVYEE